MSKQCHKCGELLPRISFHKDKSRKDGLSYTCKTCSSAMHGLYYAANSALLLAKMRIYYEDNREVKIAAAKRQYRKNPEAVKERARKWKERNLERAREVRRKWDAKERSTPEGSLNGRMKFGMRDALKKNKAGRRWEALIGYTIEDLRKHLEKQFKKHPGMSWDNMDAWQIDHIIPKAAFHYRTPEDIDFKKCWALSNLQPLWTKDNRRKWDKVSAPFQPSLLISLKGANG